MQIRILRGPTVKELQALAEGAQDTVSFCLDLIEAGVGYSVEVKMKHPDWRPRVPHWYFCSKESLIKGFPNKVRVSWATQPQDMCVSWNPENKSGYILIKNVE